MLRQIKRTLESGPVRFLAVLAAVVCGMSIAGGAYAQTGGGAEKVAPSVLQSLTAGQYQDLIVLFDDATIQSEAETMRQNLGVAHDTPGILGVKKAGYEALKRGVLELLPEGEQEIIQDYSHLPVVFMRVHSPDALLRLLQRPEVVRVYENQRYSRVLSTSLPFIHQPEVASMGIVGTGTTVAVLDDGIDTTNAAFGTCTGTGTPGLCSDTNPPSAPAGCKIACTRNFDNGVDYLHGTNVSGIVLGVAPDTRVAALNVFNNDGYAYSNIIIQAINWCIANQAATGYNIVAINMSLGGGSSSTPCGSDGFASPVSLARQAGILSAIASGNNGYTNMISSPACVPAAVSVGAVYDATYSGVSWCLDSNCSSTCTDSSPTADLVTCFSNSASFLTILGPGSFITAAGITMSGTSQATPHIAGSIAVLRGQNGFPGESVDQTVLRMTSSGQPDTDTRNGITKPRINLLAAAQWSGSATYSISGTISIYGTTTPIAGVTVNLTGGAVTTTNSSGFYQFTGLSNGSYTVTPSSSAYTFSPLTRTVNISSANVSGQNFMGTLKSGTTYSISGTISIYGTTTPIAGVTVNLTGGAVTTTNSSGFYQFTGLSKGTYTVTPSSASYLFLPSMSTVNISSTSVSGQNFAGISTGGTTYSISGTISIYGTTTPIAGVTVNLTGGAVTTTNSAGFYQFTGLSKGTYTVTPSSASYTFLPLTRTVNINSTNVSGQNFMGTPTGGTTYSISGTISIYGTTTPIAGVTVNLTGGAVTTTNSAGFYQFTGLSKGTYTVTPSSASYTFLPLTRTVNINSTNVSGQNFMGTPTGGTTYSISGTISIYGTTTPIAGVTVNLTGGAVTTTNSAGFYQFTGLSKGTYTVTPSSASYLFLPPMSTVSIFSASVSGQNFTGIPH